MDHNKLWKILKEMRIPHHLTCLLRNMYAGQEATVRTVKNLLPMQETQVRSLGREDPLEEGMATHSSVLSW